MNTRLVIFVLFYFVSTYANATTKVRVGSTPAVSSAGIYLALEKGFFKDEAIDIELFITGNSGASLTLLLSKNELDVGAGGFTSGLFNAINKGEAFKVVADKGHVAKNKEYISLIVRKDLVDSGRYKTLKDLKGMKIALPSLDGVSQQIVMDGILKKAGLTDKNITYIKASYPEINIALKTKSVDATVHLEPFLTQAILDGTAVKVLSSQEIIPDQQSAAIFFSPQFSKNQSNLAVRFLKAYLRGVRLYNEGLDNPKKWAEVVRLLKKHIKIDNDKVWSSMAPVGLNNDGQLLNLSLARDLKWYKEKGYIEKIPNLADFVDQSFVIEATRELLKGEKGK
jgi:NitT/TauT family transport system substrate-binding protein